VTTTDQARLTRPRPVVHFTASSGWINDPYGIAWVDDRYHLYFQAVPGQVLWGPDCHWGHAVSTDLLHWEEQPLALVPQPFEVGCWSGSVVHDVEPPRIFYTRVRGESWEIGSVAVATLDRTTGEWRSSEQDVVIDAPPDDLGLRCFRDPFVFRHDDGWVMLMAAAMPGETAAVLQYRSTDLWEWSYDGVLASRVSDHSDAVWTGSLWECPQLIRVGRHWVLLVSVWAEGELYHVAASVGAYDGHAFTPGPWQRITHGESAYAMSAFTDRDGEACVMSWLREEPRNNRALTERAGAHSIVSRIDIDEAGRIVLRPHPAVDASRSQLPLRRAPDASLTTVDVGAAAVDVVARASAGFRCDVREADRTRASLTIRDVEEGLVLERPGFSTQRMSLHDDGDLRIVLDADIIEIFTPRGYGAYRIAPATEPPATAIRLAAPGGLPTIYLLSSD
jgi:beta-fructofuranosidase